jgi:hypothetical protein
MKKVFLIIMVCSFNLFSNAQSLFEKATAGKSEEKNFTSHGYIRSSIYTDNNELRSVYSESALKLMTKKFRYGSAYGEIRGKYDISSGNKNHKIELREAYVDLKFERFDFRIGQQIIVWGRADGFNPTNNLTPQDFSIYSPEEDDRRLSNFVVSGTYNIHPLKISLHWVPIYKHTVFPISNTQLVDANSWGPADFPDKEIGKGSFAGKISLEKASFDGSLSWFSGYNKTSGICIENNDISDTYIYLTAHHVNVAGFDFSTSIGKYGLRGEFAYSIPTNTEENDYSIPNNQFEYTIGLDKEWSNFSIIAQYIGKQVSSPWESDSQSSVHTQQMIYWNQMLFGQQDKISHAVSLRPAISLLYETLAIEVLSLYNFTSDELMLRPKVSGDICDNICLTLGAQYYQGSENTLFNLLSKRLNCYYLECKISF